MVRSFNTPVVGMFYIVANAEHLAAIGPKPTDVLKLTHEPHWTDANAVVVRNEAGQKLGYLPRAKAGTVADLLDAGCRFRTTCLTAPSGGRLHFDVKVTFDTTPPTTPERATTTPERAPTPQEQPKTQPSTPDEPASPVSTPVAKRAHADATPADAMPALLRLKRARTEQGQ